MKTISAVAFACVLSGTLVCQANGLTFEVVQPVNRGEVMNVTGVEREALERATDLHNLILAVRRLDGMRTQIVTTDKTRQIQEARLDALEQCSIAKLSEQFKQPQEVWEKMKAAYEQKEKELTIYVNSAEPATEKDMAAFERYMETGEMNEDMVAELLAPWRIGQEILMDVYQNQDAWGERKSEGAPSFPLWEDQKYQVDKEWNDKYTKINAYFGVPPQGRPIVGDEKYDYAKAKDVEKAHVAYLALLTAKSPLKAAALPAEFRQAPVAPRPLPPKNETVVYLEAENPEAQFYPALPEPWKKYKENGFKNISPTGEMAEDFVQGLTLKETAKNSGEQTNRLVAYSALKQTVDSTTQLEKLVLENAQDELDVMRAKIAGYIDIEPNADLINPDVQAGILKRLKAKQTELLAAAEEEMKQRKDENTETGMLPEVKLEEIEDLAALKEINPVAFSQLSTEMPKSFYERDKNLLAALKKDTDGMVFLNEINAGDIDKLMQEAAATKAFMDGQDDLEKELAFSASVKIDETCLNGGI